MNFVTILLSLLLWWFHPTPHVVHHQPRAHHVVHQHKRASRSYARVAISSCQPTSDEMWIITRESSNNVHAYNPVATSTGHAFGLGQLTDSNREYYGHRLGIDPNTTSYCGQLEMMRGYIHDRYGTAANAVAFWEAHHAY